MEVNPFSQLPDKLSFFLCIMLIKFWVKLSLMMVVLHFLSHKILTNQLKDEKLSKTKTK